MTGKLNRRRLLQTGGIGVIAAGLSAPVQAAAMSKTETANLKLVNAFIKSWVGKNYDPDKVMRTYLAPDSSVRLQEDKPPNIGPDAVVTASKQWLATGARMIGVEIHDTYAKGPIVVIARTDSASIPGKPDKSAKIVGVFKIKQGKITEWTDYLDL